MTSVGAKEDFVDPDQIKQIKPPPAMLTTTNEYNPSIAYRQTFGFFPTEKDNAAEIIVFQKVRERAASWIHHVKFHSGNAKNRHHDMYMYCFGESRLLFDYALRRREVQKLLPSVEACHSFIYTVLLGMISENEKIHSFEMRKKRQQQ